VWGWAKPREKVTVSFSGQTKKATADASGNWMVKFDPMKADAKSNELKVNTITLKDVLVGDVWIGSGQSNMEAHWGVPRAIKNEMVRMFRIPKHIASETPQKDTEGTWISFGDGDSRKFSAVTLFFGVKLQAELGIPVGVIDTTWSGTKIDTWVPKEGKARKGRDGSIYNGMVAPLVPFGVKGVLWYQGEYNRYSAYPKYFHALEDLIGGWRKAFQLKNLPFYLVKIPPHKWQNRGTPQTLCDNIWQAQLRAAREIENCEIAPVHDSIKKLDLHPGNKRAVGLRLAELALSKAYGKDLPSSGPVFKAATFKGKEVEVSFDKIDKGLITRDGKDPSHFELSE
ncbi:hypothetical protein BVX97_00845, partial [bacterium E08(2017)]